MEALLTIDQIAEKLGVKRSTIYNWTHIGFIPYIKVGKFVRFRESDVENWLRKHTVAGRLSRVKRVI